MIGSGVLALLSYQTAYLKAHWPTEFFDALLHSVKDDKDKTDEELPILTGYVGDATSVSTRLGTSGTDTFAPPPRSLSFV